MEGGRTVFENSYPLFNSGRLLKVDMLKELRDFPREFFDINFENYSDGIVGGCNLEVTDDFIVVRKGILKHNNILYLLKEDITLDYECNNRLTILKVKFLPETKDNDFRKNSTEIYLDEDLEIKENEMEICRFQLRNGAALRIEHVDFNDLATEYDTVNFIHAPYAAYKESSLCPEVLRRFGSELLKCRVEDPWDIAFGMNCIQSKDPIQKEIITDYLVYKLNIQQKEYSNEDIYYYLLDVLNKAKDGIGSGGHNGRRGGRKILID